ncbi:MAG: right-handed parallel beta-helix repeat-containing protein, partial [Bacteroidales bacterium]|nr:right-handed parallel beta-helix repeat-containing protein [Bacteroidales bacterium]
MKRFILLMLAMIFTASITQAQIALVGSESFDGGTHTFTSTPGSAWMVDNTYQVDGTKCIWGMVPSLAGDSIVLTTPIYDCTNYGYVIMRFSHICKVSPMDQVHVQYRLNVAGAGGAWQDIPASAYEGGAGNYAISGFNAASYAIWNANDSLAIPSNGWWKEEIFDLSNQVSYDQVQFRFILKKGNVTGTNISYGWLIDKFELTASVHELKAPVVEFVSSLSDTVYHTGPYLIQAKVAKRTIVDLYTPKLIYTATHPVAGTVTDTLVMTAYQGDSLWQVTIPKYIFGTTINYSVRGEDSVGNYATATDGFISKHASGGSTNDSIQIGTNTTNGNCIHPWATRGTNNWTRTLYRASDVGNTSVPVSISGIAYTNNYSYYHVRHSVKCYIGGTTDNAILTGAYVDPIAAGATLVYSGDLNVIPGWNKVTFQRTAVIPAGQNVVVYWIDTAASLNPCSQNSNNIYWANNTMGYTNVARAAVDWSGCNSSSTSNSTLDGLPTTILYFGESIDDSNSVALEKILVEDSVATSPTTQVPVSVSFRNKGYADLHSAVINWTVNGVAQTPYTWTGNLPDDYVDTVVIGNYHPRVNTLDTIVVSINMPNNVIDTNYFDDTIVKVVYGSSDIVFTWIDAPHDTVYSTGPYLMKLYARTLSGATIDSLNMVYTYPDTNNTPISVTVPMTYQGGNMWHAVIPNIRFGNRVNYSVTKTDSLGNVVNTSDWYYIKFVGGGSSQYHYIGDTVNYGIEYEVPFYGYDDYSWSRIILPGWRLLASATLIRNIAFKVEYSYLSAAVNNQQCYMKLVSDSMFNTADYVNPASDGATLVWSGSVLPKDGEWMDITLNTPFVFNNNSNLMIYWMNNDGSGDNDVEWVCDKYLNNNNAIACSDYGGMPNYSGWWTEFPVMRILTRGRSDTNSVALVEIVSPSDEGITAGAYPIKAMIRNVGIADLTSCNISYSINHGTPVTYAWTGDLPSDFVDTVTLGTYTAVAGKIDNITMWVDSPNHKYDSAYYDDTLSVDIVTCNGTLQGEYALGDTNAEFSTMAQFVKTLEKCGIDGKVTLNIQPGTYQEDINLKPIAGLFTSGDTLIITSSTGDTSDVVFTGGGVILDEIQNVTISNITIDISSGDGVNFASACDNIEINGCNFKLNPTATGTTACGIKYSGNSNSPIMGNIRILNNSFSGGGTGIYIYYTHPNQTAMSTSNKYITILNNTFNNIGQYGMYSYYYNRYDSIAHNVFNMRTTSTTQYGCYMYYYNRIDGGFFNNKITLNSSSSCYGFYDYYLNVAATGAQHNAPIFNNEIRRMSSGTFYGIYVYYSNLDVMNNTIYSQGSGTCYNIYSSYANATYFSNVKGNISYTSTTGTGYPLYISNATYAAGIDLDYNDYYSTGAYVGYVGSAISSLSALVAAAGNNTHSMNVNPQFTNINNNLDFDNDAKLNFMMPNLGNFAFDIDNSPRYGNTCMGAYTVEPEGFDLAAVSVTIPDASLVNTSVPVTLEVLNFGATPITSATINWTINGVSQTPFAWTAVTPLPAFESTTITIGNYTFATAGGVDIKAWFSNVNNTLDSNRNNDTVANRAYVCGGAISGIYTVGSATANFTTLEEALMAFENCGLTGNTELQFVSGTYDAMSISGFDAGNYTLTITSASGNASDVKFVTTSGNALSLSSSKGITFKNITFDASATTAVNAVQLSGQINNVTFYGCEMLANPSATTSTWAVVRYANSSGSAFTLTNVKFIKNHMNGGYYGMYMYYTAGNSSGMLNTCNVRIDSNIIENYYYSGLYSYYYNHYKSISHNTFRTRTGGTQATYNMYFYYYHAVDTINGNKIEIRNTGTSYGMYCNYYFNYPSYSTGAAKIINNEIRKLSGAGATYGMYIYYYMMADVYNNTLLLGGTGICYGLYFYNTNSTYHINAKNNIIRITTTGTGYPIYISSATYATATYVSLDYNDYSSTGAYVGYIGSTKTTLSALQTSTGQDAHSISVAPQWKDSAVDLDLDNYMPFLTTNVGGLATDIKGQPRATTTIMGAYSPELYDGKDIKLESVEGFPESGDLCSANYSDIEFILTGNGLVKTEFNQTALTAYLSISGAVTFDTMITINTGSMEIFDRTTISMVKNLNITPAGIYHVKAWIACSADTNYVNDTISFDYIANKVALPIDEDFANGIPLTMRVADNNTAIGWEVMYDSNATGTVIPATGNAMIGFDGSRGAMTRLYTRQLDLSGTSQPVLDFWYWHDTAATVSTMDYTDVRLTF